MNNSVFIKNYESIPINMREILRYSGYGEATEEVTEQIKNCLKEAENDISFKVCYCELPLKTEQSVCDFGTFSTESQKLAICLKGSSKVLLFAATIGSNFDRIITKYSKISPFKALLFQSIGAERIESLCDTFCKDFAMEKSVKLTPRFSPGYGDLSLETQEKIFSLLDCNRKIGLFLNDSKIMSPTKSVTAFVGITENND